MKLAEALDRRAALMSRVQLLKNQLQQNVKVQEGDTPAERPEDILASLESALSELQKLIFHINRTNLAAVGKDGRCLTDLLAERDVMKIRVKILRDSLNRLMENDSRYSRQEIKFVRTIDPTSFQKDYDNAASLLRHLDLRIQELGWTTELI